MSYCGVYGWVGGWVGRIYLSVAAFDLFLVALLVPQGEEVDGVYGY